MVLYKNGENNKQRRNEMYSISDFIIGLSNRGERFRSEMIDMIEGEGLAERCDDVRYAYDYLLEEIEAEADSEEEFLAQRALRTV